MNVNISNKNTYLGIAIVLTLVLSGIIYNWQYDRDYNTLYKDGKIIAKHRWHVEMERTYSTIKYSYQKDNCLDIGGRLTETRCYYPEDYYLKLNRQLSSIKLNNYNYSDNFIIQRNTSYYKYGTKGILSGKLVEEITHLKNVYNIKDFPNKYIVSYHPKDISNYRLVWDISKLKDINLNSGNYTQCYYHFGNIIIDISKECSKLDYTYIDKENEKITIYFKEDIGIQTLDVNLIDPVPEDINASILPILPTNFDNLIGYCNSSDQENDPVEYYFKWYKNGTLNITGLNDGGNDFNIYISDVFSNATKFNGFLDLKVIDDYVYTIGYDGDSFVILNISNKKYVTQTALFVDNTSLFQPTDLDIQNNYAYIGSNYSLIILNVTNPNNITKINVFTNITSLNGTINLKNINDYVYITSAEFDGFAIINITNKTNITQVSSFVNTTSLDLPSGLDINNNYTYVASYNSGSLTILNVTDTNNITQISSFINTSSLNGATDVFYQDNYVYITSSSLNSLTILNVTDPNNITQTDSFVDISVLWTANSVKVQDNYAYIVSINGDEFTILNITNKNNITLIDNFESPTYLNYAYDIDIQDNYAYVASRLSDTITVFKTKGYSSGFKYNIANLSSDYTNIGDEWIFSCMANDGTGDSIWVNSTPVIIVSAIPIINSSTITPLVPFNNNKLIGYCNATDLDLDNLTYYWNWYKNGILNESGYNNYYGFKSGFQYNIANLSSNYTNIGDNITFGCIAYDNSNNSTELISSNVTIQEDLIFNLKFDDINLSRIYEFNTIANISVNINNNLTEVCLGIDAPNYGNNYTCGYNSTYFMYNISILRESNFSDGLITKNISINSFDNINLTIILDNHSDIISAKINISCKDNVCNGLMISIDNWNKSYFHNNTQLYNIYSDYYEDNYFRDESSTEYSNNISHIYQTSSSWSFFYKTPDNPTYLKFKLYSILADINNNVSFYDPMNNLNNSDPTNYNLSTINTTYPIGIKDNFERNSTISNWVVTRTDNNVFNYELGDRFEITSGNNDNYLSLESHGKVCDTGESQTSYMIEDYSDLRFSNFFRINTSNYVSGGCFSGIWAFNGVISFSLTDGTNSVTIKSLGTSCTWTSCSATLKGIYSMKRSSINSNTWYIYYGNNLTDNIGTFDTTSLDSTSKWNLKFSHSIKLGASGGCVSCGGGELKNNVGYNRLYNFEVGGIHLFKDINGENYSLSGNFTSKVFHNTTDNIIAATLIANDTIPTGTSIKYYMSVDDINYERVSKGSRHIFNNLGNNLSYRVELESNSITLTPIVSVVNVKVVSSQIKNLSIDINFNSSVQSTDYSFNGTLNQTNTPLNLSFDISNYTSSDEIEVAITSLTSGLIRIEELSVNSSLNEINLNKTNLEDCNNCKINFTNYGDAISNYSISNLEIDFKGYKNYTVNAISGGTIITRILQIYYSPFNISIIPLNIEYWDISPNIYSYVQYNIPPFGNANGYGNPFWNITRLRFNHTYDIFIKYNESVDTCAKTWFQGYNYTNNLYNNITISNDTEVLIEKLSDTINISTWTNISCASINSTLILPYFCFSSLCSDCVRTYDYKSNCEYIE